MNIRLLEASNDYEIYQIVGEITYDNVKDLSDIRESNSPITYIDLSECTYIDSSGFGFFVLVHQSKLKSHQKIILTHIPQILLEKFETQNLSKILFIQ